MSRWFHEQRASATSDGNPSRAEAAISIAKRAVARDRQAELELVLSVIERDELWREMATDDGQPCTSMQDVLDDLNTLAVEVGTADQ